MHGFLVFLFIILMAFPIGAENATYVTDPQYRQMVRQLMEYAPPSYNYGTFRKTYTLSSYYDPIGEAPVEKILDYAYQVHTAEDEQAISDALGWYNMILSQHLANIMVVRQAYALARQDKRFGNADKLMDIYNGLSRYILSSGDGLKLNSAYNAITFAEELFILGQLGYRIEETKYHEISMAKYNMHFVQNPKPEEPLTIFINIAVPMRAVQEMTTNKSGTPQSLKFKG